MSNTFFKIDWLSILLFTFLIAFGWISIYSTTLTGVESKSYLDLSTFYGKQLLWIVLSFVIILFVLTIESKFYERFSSVIYVISLILLLGLMFFGKTINGQTAWYSFGGFSLQPAEFAKAAVALAVAKYLSGLNVNIKKFKHQLNVFIIIGIPIILILLQPDTGSALVYFSFFIAFYREGLPGFYIWGALAAIIIFVAVLLLGSTITSIFLGLIFFAIIYFKSKQKSSLLKPILIGLLCISFTFSVNFLYNSVLQPHQKARFEVLINPNVNNKSSGYNLYQSEVAIGSGGFAGKGFLNGTQKQGRFVPEQHTDYIFTTIGEEFGFIGSALVILLFVAFLSRILYLAERQKRTFSRVYGYGVFGILFIHFFVNIGMVTGLIPTIGIPLPFFSYGGSGLWGFTILVFILLKLDADRIKLGS
ncbi:rod shape-determining protein RodA [Flavobacteriaceae bacterium 14752]|uniref:rod shape-determining protein RodA n=1 Tax=Mesohalobacter salilacus TaxID=2491711 RepID=UPI000F6431FC|nr:rod shape-determining protein RodA [Flavobacteriaceae bacterium 14752]